MNGDDNFRAWFYIPGVVGNEGVCNYIEHTYIYIICKYIYIYSDLRFRVSKEHGNLIPTRTLHDELPYFLLTPNKFTYRVWVWLSRVQGSEYRFRN